MCGLLGIVSAQTIDDTRWRIAGNLQNHRGPDDKGEWSGRLGEHNIRLGHQRLSIQDLSVNGAQPMQAPNSGSVLVFNGEIYNFPELRQELERKGVQFSGKSDTEVLLHALETWGLHKTQQKLNGMWAFAWLDVKNHCLHLSRDRCGEKPLYISCKDNTLYFASELKTILSLQNKRHTLNYQVIGEYLDQVLLDVGVDTFIEGVEQIRAGHSLTFNMQGGSVSRTEQAYWDCPVNADPQLRLDDFVEELRSRFLNSVAIRLRSDVTVGVLLSGGLDSSAIAAAVQEAENSELHLLSAVSEDSRFDESYFIDIVAKHLGSPVVKVQLPSSPRDIFDTLEEATWHMDAPLGSLSNVSHYLLMKAAKDHDITVILSGQGADELLCGYRKYLGFHLQILLKQGKLAEFFTTLLKFYSNDTVISQFRWAEAKRYLPAILREEKKSYFGQSLDSYSPLHVGITAAMTLNARQKADLLHYSVPTLNHYEDRMSMAWSREIRLPFLDPNLIEMLISAPPSYKLRQGWTKYALRKAMQPYLPEEIIWRKDKQGFINPQSEWLKGGLRQMIVDEYFCEDAWIFKRGIIDRGLLLEKYNIFCEQGVNKGRVFFREIFSPLALEIWLRKYAEYLH